MSIKLRNCLLISFILQIVSGSGIQGNLGAAKVNLSGFNYALSPDICQNFSDCFNCTLSHCAWING